MEKSESLGVFVVQQPLGIATTKQPKQSWRKESIQ
jgi:hypothetical protein